MHSVVPQVQVTLPTNIGGVSLSNVIIALVVLVVGWIIALIVSRVVAGALRRTGLDDRLARGAERTPPLPISSWLASVVFWLLFIFALIGFFQTLGLTQINAVLNAFLNEVSLYLPKLIGAIILGLAAWVIASILRSIVTRVLVALRIDQRVGEQVTPEGAEPPAPLSQTAGEAVYWLTFLLFLPAILGVLNLTGLLGPVQGMVDKVVTFLPNLAAAALILVVGWFVATIVRRIVTNLLAAVGLDRLGAQVGLGQALGNQRLSNLVGLVVYILILLPVLTAALDALQIEAITRPFSIMLTAILAALPNIFAAALLLIIAYFVARLVASLVTNLLAGLGFDTLPARVGLSGDTATPVGRTPSEVAGALVLVVIMLFATIEASQLLGFTVLADLIAQFTVFAGQIVLGLIIIAIGLFLANFGARAVQATGLDRSGLLATATRVAILALALAMGLRQMGVANEIVILAFGLLLGALAVAVALAFGIGGREVAQRQLNQWIEERNSAPLQIDSGDDPGTS